MELLAKEDPTLSIIDFDGSAAFQRKARPAANSPAAAPGVRGSLEDKCFWEIVPNVELSQHTV